jgi:hypothetical protein
MSGQPKGCVSDHIRSPDCVNRLLTGTSNSIYNFWLLDEPCNCLVCVPTVEIVVSSVEIVMKMQKI